MSRSASKSRVDSRGTKAPVQGAPPQSNVPPVEEEDVVAGYLTQTQWEDLLRLEDMSNEVEEIMEDLVGKVMEECLKSHIHKQLVVFTVCWAKDFLVEAMELAFLYRDPGDGPEKAFSATEDPQPVPSPIDSWAQGCVPVVSIVSSPPPPPPPPPTTPHKALGLGETEPEFPRPPCPGAQLNSSRVHHEKDGERSGPADQSPHRVLIPTPPGKSNRKKKMKILLNPNTAAKQSIQSSTQPLFRLVTQEEQEEDRKRRIRLPADGFDSLHASKGKQSASKRHHVLQPVALVSPQYEILDALLPKRQTTHGLPLSGHKYNQQRAVSTSMKLKPLANCTDKKLQQRPNGQPRTDFWLEPRHRSTPAEESGIIWFSGSLRLDTMDLVPGVSLSESQGLQNSPLNAGTQVCLDNMAELRPIRRYPALPSLTNEQRSKGIPAQAMPLK